MAIDTYLRSIDNSVKNIEKMLVFDRITAQIKPSVKQQNLVRKHFCTGYFSLQQTFVLERKLVQILINLAPFRCVE